VGVVIHEDATRSPAPDGPPVAEPRDPFDAALAVIAQRTTDLGAAIAEVAFADAARLANELRHALSWAAALVAQLPDGPERATALRQLGELRGPATGLLQLAPSPSAAALAAAESGDRTAWIREEQAWIADRLASGTNPGIPRSQRARRATRPDSPKARRSDAFKASGEAPASDVTTEIAAPLDPDEEGTR
jgi:hypothetical protein